MNITMSPNYLLSDRIGHVKCYLTDNYGFPTDPDSLPDPVVNWSLSSTDAVFLDGDTTAVNFFGVAENRCKAGDGVSYNCYINACVVIEPGGSC